MHRHVHVGEHGIDKSLKLNTPPLASRSFFPLFYLNNIRRKAVENTVCGGLMQGLSSICNGAVTFLSSKLV